MTSISEHFANIGDYLLPIQKRHSHLNASKAGPCSPVSGLQSRLLVLHDLAQLDNDDWSELKVNLENPGLHTIWHNANFDLRVLQSCGINVGGQVDDTMLMSYLLTNGQVVLRSSNPTSRWLLLSSAN